MILMSLPIRVVIKRCYCRCLLGWSCYVFTVIASNGVHAMLLLSFPVCTVGDSDGAHVTSVLQVTITAEQECLYMCWPRLRLERVLRHRPSLKVVLSNIIGETPLWLQHSIIQTPLTAI
jgi:hypothetical protein